MTDFLTKGMIEKMLEGLPEDTKIEIFTFPINNGETNGVVFKITARPPDDSERQVE